MKAKDVMTTAVVTVGPDMRVEEIAQLFLDKQISGAPVVDAYQNLIGVVSEGDLMRRLEDDDDGASPRRSWWLQFVASSEERAADYVKVHGGHAKDVMSRNVHKVGEDATLGEIARLLEEHRIKRVPVVTDGKLVGIVSRANLLRGLAVRKDTGLAPTSVDDQAIRQRVLDDLSKEGWLSHGTLNVIVENGVVQLWGFVDSEKERQAMTLVVENAEGVSAVEDHLGYVAPYLRAD
ncbi:MAG: CBS domain-containing protein [Rhodospirillaceae bacterium]|jgi:CBS domain-containing protein|nr:CBS domain-containing protein [Rhodospirillaceae bacterium]MBT5809893.1 CBS domain-containing protein [Rhodospirillaceae bacterium]